MVRFPHLLYVRPRATCSVLNDLVRLSQDQTLPPFPINSDLPLNNDYKAKFYVRITCSDGTRTVPSLCVPCV